MEEIKPELAQSKYHPLSLEEYIELKRVLSTITSHMADSLAGYIWGNFNAVRNAKEGQPCTCGSSGAHWGRAIQHLREWVKSKE